jgi:oligosaccharide repeat unit polymerase
MLLAAPPTGMARFAAASMYLPVSLCLFPALRKKYRFILLFIFSIVVLFPIMNIFRYYSESISPNIYDMITEQYNTLNFDSYSMFMRVFKDNIITNGEQLLGALLFFVPRSIWPTKPIGSGHYVADIQNLSFANISMPYFGEGYINFGIIGVILFTVLLAYITARVDKWYLQNVANRNHDIRQIPYFMSLGLLFFMLRGDLMSSFAYMCGFLAAYYFIKKVIVRV